MMKTMQRVNPFAIGGAFVEYCVEKGYLVMDVMDHEVKYYLTEEGEVNLKEEFGITLHACAKIKEGSR